MTGPFAFATAGDIRFGRGAAREAVPALAAMGDAALLVTGGTPERADWLRAALEQAGVRVTVFAVPGEPDLPLIERGMAAARASAAQSVIALGGGAAIDAGKAIAALLPAVRPVRDHLEVVGKGLTLEHDPLPFAAIPTTAGTGAEVTRNAVIAVPEARRKVSLRDARMLPKLAIVDPALTDGCPRGVTLASGLDAITQVIEPYLSSRANVMTDALCRDAIPKGLAALRDLMGGEQAGARDAMAWVSLCGGLALANSGLGVVHGLAGPLGGLSGAAHGTICGALLPAGLRANARAGQGDARLQLRMGEVRGWIAQALGGAAPDAFDTLHRWSRAAGLPGLDAQGITEEMRAQAADAAVQSSSMKANPVALSRADLSNLMEQAR
ncbi:iron-containing alcohol dehydrogenase [Marivita sp. GX14005]|uniref:iron-containing alcohol dehydrogenase n=1 Tax=Marivita sp. GX14005 TaxID=2942276 RepID=UPI002019FA88|nr:iron-containing alcohol dehydrogenase [Marivita sp. GX14005]MCL3882948.1 iron-containing alcohol dehydrogenase [Marivita sp. GX14005]